MKKLKVGFTYDLQTDFKVKPGEPRDKYAEMDVEETIAEVETALRGGGYNVVRVGHVRSLLEKIRAGETWDIIFNICEGMNYRNREAQVPAVLEIFDIPYVGSDPLTMSVTLDKIVAKKIIQHHNIPTPAFVSVCAAGEIAGHRKWIEQHLPLIIKPSQEGTSKGVSKKSRCETYEKVRERAAWVVTKYKQPAIIEEFISGYEFTVAVIGNGKPDAYPPVQISIKDQTELGDDFYTYGRVISTDIKYLCPPREDKSVSERLMKCAVDSYLALECRDFSRIDFRMDRDMRPYFIECNPLPHIGTSDVFPLVAAARGTTYEKLIRLILESALQRYGLV